MVNAYTPDIDKAARVEWEYADLEVPEEEDREIQDVASQEAAEANEVSWVSAMISTVWSSYLPHKFTITW